MSVRGACNSDCGSNSDTTAKSRKEAEPFPPEEVQRRIEVAARKGMEKFVAGKFRPYYIPPPYCFVLRFRTVQKASAAARSPLVERDGEYAVRHTAESFVDGFNLSQHVYAPSSDRLTLLTRLLESDPQGRKFLEQATELYWRRCLEPGSVPEERPARAPTADKRYFGAR